jgi:GNAT superfamily N-acetyltransferase
MQRLRAVMERPCRPTGFTSTTFDAPPCGTAYVTISPGEQDAHASPNFNRVHLCGADGGLTREGLARLLDRFGEAGVTKFFVWLSPGPAMDAVRSWLSDLGLAPHPYVAYPTLARSVGEAAPVATEFEVHEVEPAEAKQLAAHFEGVAWPDFVRSAGSTGFHHFMAFSGERPVASATLYVGERLGYLGAALSAEPFRNRGAQKALIAKRMDKAKALGCDMLVSETLSILPASLGNLQKAGFVPIYEKQVYDAPPAIMRP